MSWNSVVISRKVIWSDFD